MKSDGSETAYITEEKSIASKLEQREKLFEFKDLSLRDIVAYIKFEKPTINIKTDSRYSNTVVSEDVSAWDIYFSEVFKVLQLDEFDPRRAKWEEQRERYFQRLDQEKRKSD